MHTPRVVTLCLLLLVFSLTASADLVYNFGTAFPGDPNPDGTGPWLTATFAQAGANQVTLTLTSHLVGDNFLTELDFNTNPAGALPGALTIVFNSGVNYDSLTQGTDCCKADGDGYYDIGFIFPQPAGDRFGAGDSAVFTITGTGITPDYFKFLSKDSGGSGPYYAAAHIQGISSTAADSTWIYADPGGNGVPEPATLFLLGTSFLIVARKLKTH